MVNNAGRFRLILGDALFNRSKKRTLLLVIKSDEILNPKGFKRFQVFPKFSRNSDGSPNRTLPGKRRRVKRHPNVLAGKVDLYPRVGVPLLDDKNVRCFVILTLGKTVDDTRRNSLR